MDMYISLSVSLCHILVKYVHLIELLCALRAVFEHGAHSSVTVDIRILTLDIALLGRLEGKIFIDLHEPCVHFPHSGPVGTIENICLGCLSVSLFNEDLFNDILHLFNSGSA